MIDHELRRTGIGASEVAAVIGMSPYQTPFDLYVRKLGLVDEQRATAVQRRGKYFERGVIDWYADLTGRQTEWFDKTIVHPTRRWQMASPDAWLIEDGRRVAEVQAKTVNWRNVEEYGESGTDDVPPHCLIQSIWTMSTADTRYGELAALCGMDELRTYRIHRDADIEAVLLEEVERFWKDHIIARVPPDIGHASLANAYLKKKFPAATQDLRVANAEQSALLADLKRLDEEWDRVNNLAIAAENRIKLSIGNGEGLLDGPAKITWRKNKDTIHPNWEQIARQLAVQHSENLAQLIKDNVIATPGSRVLRRNWTWGAKRK